MQSSESSESTQEAVRQYWNSRPCNIRHSSKQVGTLEYFEEVEQRKYFVEPHVPQFADFRAWKGKTVVEVGCGIGTAAISFLKAGCEKYIGVDISDVSIEIAQKRLAVYEFDETRAHLIVGDIEKEDTISTIQSLLHNGVADLVYSFGVLHHTSNIRVAIKNIKQLVHPSHGTFKLMLYAKHSWKNIMIDNGLDQFEAQSGVPIAMTFSKEEADYLLQSCGFRVDEISQDHIFPYKIDQYKNYIYEKEDWFKSMSPEMFNALEKQLGWHLCITCTHIQ